MSFPERSLVKQLLDRLPRGIQLYNRDPDNKKNNVRNLFTAFAQEFFIVLETIRMIKRSRMLEEAAVLFGEEDSWVLDHLVFYAGTIRQKGWNNARLLSEFDMDVFEQESHGNANQIKTILAHWFSTRYPARHVLTPEVEVEFPTNLDGASYSVVPTDHTGTRPVQGEDIFLFANKRPFSAPENPLRWPYIYSKNKKPHTRYGIFDKILFICVPHEAIPKADQNAFIPRLAPDDGMGGNAFNTVTNLRNSPGRGLVGVPERVVDQVELTNLINRSQAIIQGQFKAIIWAYGGFIPRSAPLDPGTGEKLFNTVANKYHGVGGRVNGDINQRVELENLGVI